MAQNLMRVILRTFLVLLAAVLVAAAAYLLTPPFDPKRAEAAIVEQAKPRTPIPGGEDALRRVVGELRDGRPDYAKMNKNLGDAVRQTLPQQRRQLASLGPLSSLTYLGGISRIDLYRARFAHGSLLGVISIGKGDVIQTFGFIVPGGSTPQDWIDNYSRFAMPERVKRMVTQLGILLAAAVVGRLALRIRL